MKKLLSIALCLLSLNIYAEESPFPAHMMSIRNDCRYTATIIMHGDLNGKPFQSKLEKPNKGSASKGFGTEPIFIKEIEFYTASARCRVAFNQLYNRSHTIVYFQGNCSLPDCKSHIKIMPR